jgi:DNA-binding NarL/FixJ family response regulator
MRVVVADDQLLVCAGVKAMLEKSGGFEVVATDLDGQDCLDAVILHEPEALILDLEMPRLDGFAVLDAIHARALPTLVIILSAKHDAALCKQSLKAGAKGYLTKDLVMDELTFALQCVSRGHTYVTPSLSVHPLAGTRPVRQEQQITLSPRQTDVLRAIAQGKSNKLIARDMDISVKTVEYHRAELMQKLNIHDVAGLTRYAIGHRLATTD